MVNVGDMGKDYEHGQQLLRKLNEFRGTGSGVRGGVGDADTQNLIHCL